MKSEDDYRCVPPGTRVEFSRPDPFEGYYITMDPVHGGTMAETYEQRKAKQEDALREWMLWALIFVVGAFCGAFVHMLMAPVL